MKKGFTLIELLGVIVVLVAITLITTVIIVGFVKDTNNTIDEGTKKLIYSATERYLNDYMELKDGTYQISINTLIANNLLSETIVSNFENIPSCSLVNVSVVSGNISYELDTSVSCQASQ